MDLSQHARKPLRKIFSSEFISTLESWVWRIRRGRKNKEIKNLYFKNHEVKKLQIGSGQNLLQGWLNTDYYPGVPGVLHLDAARRFPFQGGQFDYVYSEHVLEHFSYEAGGQMLSECFRVLKSKGKIRIATPDLLFLMELFRKDKSETQKRYIDWAVETHIKNASCAGDVFVINHFMRGWGHQFIYDQKTLRFSMEKAGFIHVVPCEVGRSEDKELQGLEHDSRMPAEFLKLETIILEGMKP